MDKKRKLNLEEDGIVPNTSMESSSLLSNCEEQQDDEAYSEKKDDCAKRRSTDLTSERVAEHAQLIIDEMEMKRKNDETLISQFRKTLEIQMDTWCDVLEQTLAKTYEKNNNLCQEKLQQLYTVLGRINQLEEEMSAFKESLKALYSDVEGS